LIAVSVAAGADPVNPALEALVSENHLASEASITIQAPIAAVWDYNSHNEYAQDWSVYFKLIGPCPLTDCPENAGLQPGDIGYVRRSYRSGIGSAIYWDEKTLAVTPTPNGIVKQMQMYNLHGFPLAEAAEYLIEQTYEETGPQSTKLTFKSRLYNLDKLAVPVSRLTYSTWLLAGFARGQKRTSTLYFENLSNIKAAIEEGAQYVRVYPYEPGIAFF
jgi:hypothetical protein